MLLPVPAGASESLNNVLASARDQKDSIFLAVKNDPLILKLGSRLYHRHGHMTHLNQYIMQKMRELGRFLIEARKLNDDIIRLQDCINAQQFRVTAEAARKTAGYKEKEKKFKTPSLALKIGHSLKKCAEIVLGEAFMLEDESMKRNAKAFIRMYDMDWNHEISNHALRSMEENTWNSSSTLPLTRDVLCLQKHLKEKSKESKNLLSTEVTPEAWHTMCEITLCQVTLFKCRRGGETQRLTLETYQKTMEKNSNTEVDEEILSSLSKFEKHLCKSLTRVTTRGKRGRKVPILLTKQLKSSVDLLNETRQRAGVHEENTYVFARVYQGSESPRPAHECLSKYAESCGAKYPKNLTTTKLRKHIATMSQIVNSEGNELEQLATYMGHSLDVHRHYYRLPEDTLQCAKVAKLLLNMENGQSEVKGKFH